MKLNSMEKIRCGWCERDDLYRKYHDEEWGRPVQDDKTFFEFLVLESFQAGLSWHTILRKRENFRHAFASFDVEKVAVFDEAKVEELMQNPGIVRNRAKILAAINNAQKFLEVQREFDSFSNYFWHFTGGRTIVNFPKTLSEVPATTPLSDAIAKDLKVRGFKFLGSTVVYAHMQATGMVDDHLADCHCKILSDKW